MTRNCIVTINVSRKWDCLGQITSDTMANYARKIKADFVNVNSVVIPGLGCREYEKFQLYDLLGVYDRVLLLDFDAMVVEGCPNIFNVVHKDKLGVATHHLIGNRTQDPIDQFGDKETDWNAESFYWDSGVIVASKIHRDLFEYKEQPRFTACGCAEERTFNYRIYKYKTQVHNIGHRFHFQPGREEERQKNDVPFIIHWAGGGRGGLKNVKIKAEQIKSDIANYEDWKKNGYPKQWS